MRRLERPGCRVKRGIQWFRRHGEGGLGVAYFTFFPGSGVNGRWWLRCGCRLIRMCGWFRRDCSRLVVAIIQLNTRLCGISRRSHTARSCRQGLCMTWGSLPFCLESTQGNVSKRLSSVHRDRGGRIRAGRLCRRVFGSWLGVSALGVVAANVASCGSWIWDGGLGH